MSVINLASSRTGRLKPDDITIPFRAASLESPIPMSKDKDAEKIAKSLEKIKGVKAALADTRAGSAVVFVGEEIKPEALIAAVATAGSFQATLKVKDEIKKE